MSKMIALGISDNEKCDCCGKDNLKRTIALGTTDGDGNWIGDVQHFGTTCAARALNPKNAPSTYHAASRVVDRRIAADAKKLREQRGRKLVEVVVKAWAMLDYNQEIPTVGRAAAVAKNWRANGIIGRKRHSNRQLARTMIAACRLV